MPGFPELPVVKYRNPDGSMVKVRKHPTAIIGPDCHLGDNCYLSDGCVLDAWCRLGFMCYLGDGCHLGTGCQLGAWCGLGTGCTLGAWCYLEEGCDLGNECHLGDNRFLSAYTNIGEGCTDILDLGHEDRGYNRCAWTTGKGDVLMSAGCHVGWTLAQAREHWGHKNYPNRARGDAYLRLLDFIEVEAKLRGWTQ